ncbi:MAG: UbiA family prenyltransferase [Myxococcota bacterium]|nr:UbiA family prenyltransferase [Myxococcota bacterium]
MQAAAPSATTERGLIADALAIARYHIVLVAMVACVAFGWIETGQRPWIVALVCGLDWFLINLMNRVTDLAEDAANGIAGTARVARSKRALTILAASLMVGSFVATHLVWPALTPFRVAVHVIGLGYNYPIVPTLRGMTRFKEMYFFKNFGSSVLFVLTCFVYPLAAYERVASWGTIACLVLFFVPFELTYEVLYDLRDLEGDRREGVPTYPVVHGPQIARRIIDALLIAAAAALVAGLATGALGLREGLMLVAPATQLAFYRPRFARGLTAHDCIVLTHLGTAQVALWIVGTWLWSLAGLPDNVYLV